MLGQHRSRGDVAGLVWRVLRLLALFGVIWSTVIWVAIPLVVGRFFSLTGDLAAETIFGLRAIALSIPFALVAIGATGSLEGLQRFQQLSIWRSALSVAQFGIPTIAALWHPDVGWAIAGLAISRVISVVIWLRILNDALPAQSGHPSEFEDIKSLLRFGGWLSVSNLISPLMVNIDRIYLTSILSPSIVAAYTVPYDSLFRLTTIPFAAVGAMFPALAETQSHPHSSSQMIRFAVVALVTLALPPLLIGTIFAEPLLTLWLGSSFALASLSVFKILIVGVFFSCTAHIPYALLQAHGRSDITAKLHLFELPVFLGVLIFSALRWGVEGAAVATVLRVAFDTMAAYVCSIRMHHFCRDSLIKGLGMVMLASFVLAVPILTENPIKLAILACFISTICITIFIRGYLHWRNTVLRSSRRDN